MQKPKLNGEEWKILASRLETQGWIEDMYDPKSGKRYWRGTKWGERHYQKACMLTDVNKLFSGNTLKQLENANLGFEDLDDKQLYKLGLIKEVFDDETFHDTKALTREGYEWFYAYTKLKGKKLTQYQAKSQITRSIAATLQVIYLMFALIARNLTDGLAKREKRKRRR